jgi:hypothetical protein
MAGSSCTKCGASVSSGSLFCARCGAFNAPPKIPSVRRRRPGATIVILVVAGILVLAVALWYVPGAFKKQSSGGGATVDITSVNFIVVSGVTTCWGSVILAEGGQARAGGQWTVNEPLGYYSSDFPHSCSVQSVSVATPGFSFVTANVPLYVETPPGFPEDTLSVTVSVPTTSYTGMLALNLTVNSP